MSEAVFEDGAAYIVWDKDQRREMNLVPVATECTCGHGELWHDGACAVWACYCEKYQTMNAPDRSRRR